MISAEVFKLPGRVPISAWAGAALIDVIGLALLLIGLITNTVWLLLLGALVLAGGISLIILAVVLAWRRSQLVVVDSEGIKLRLPEPKSISWSQVVRLVEVPQGLRVELSDGSGLQLNAAAYPQELSRMKATILARLKLRAKPAGRRP